MSRVLLIRADASISIGSGHVMRCIALAQAWQERENEVVFLCAPHLPSGLHQRLTNEHIPIVTISQQAGSHEDAQTVINIAQQYEKPLIVVDGYHFGADYQLWIKDVGLPLLTFDRAGYLTHYNADIVLNPNSYAPSIRYESHEPHTEFLLGTRFALLRRDFWTWQNWHRETRPEADKILVTLGGTDPKNVTGQLLPWLEQIEQQLDLLVVLGGGNPHIEQILAFREATKHHLQVLHSVDDMAELMSQCDVAISASGSTVWELAFMGVPMILIMTAENQALVFDHLLQLGIAIGLKDDLSDVIGKLTSLLQDPIKRYEMSTQGRQLVDGLGCHRIIDHLMQL